MELNIPKLKGVLFETTIIERYRRRESSVEEALIEMHLAGVSVCHVEISRKRYGEQKYFFPPSERQEKEHERKVGLRALVTTCKRLNASLETTIEALKENFLLDDESARIQIKLYW